MMTSALSEDVRAAIAAEYARGEGVRTIADRFGLSDRFVRRTLVESGVKIRPRGKPSEVTEREREIVDAYRTVGAITTVADQLGVSRQFVQHMIANFERKTGERLPRTGNELRIERNRSTEHERHVTWRCAGGCGRERRVTPSYARAVAMCRECDSKRKHGRRRYVSDEALEDVIARARSGESLYAIAIRLGFSRNYLWGLSGIVYTELRYRGDVDSIDKIWPRGVPKYAFRGGPKR